MSSENVFSNIKVTPLKKAAGSIRANGSVTIAGIVDVNFVISDGSNGLWVKLPQHSYKAKDKDSGQEVTRYVRDVKIPDQATAQQLSELAIAEYNRVASGEEAQPSRDGKPF